MDENKVNMINIISNLNLIFVFLNFFDEKGLWKKKFMHVYWA